MSRNKIIWTSFTIMVVVVLAYGIMSQQADAPSNQSESQEIAANDLVAVSYEGIDGHTALDLLKQNYEITTEAFGGLGEFVTSIEGMEAGSSHFWAFYVNGEMAQVGASQYSTSDGDLIEWRLVEIR